MLASDKKPDLNFVREGKKYAMTMKIPNHRSIYLYFEKKLQTTFSNGKKVHINLFSLLKIFVIVEN